MKRKTKPIIIGICAMAAVATVTVAVMPNFLKAKSENTVISKETEVKYGNLVTGVTESGSLEIGSVSQTYDYDWTGSSSSSSGTVTTSSSSGSSSGGSQSTMGGMSQQSGMSTGSSSSSGSNSSGTESSSSSSSSSSSGSSSSSDEISLEIGKVCASAGQVVSKGDVLYTVTDESVEEAETILKAQITSAKLALQEAEYEKKSTLLDAKYELESNQLLGSTAQKEYNATIKELQSEVDSAQDALDEADERIDAIPSEIKALEKQKSSSSSTSTSSSGSSSQIQNSTSSNTMLSGGVQGGGSSSNSGTSTQASGSSSSTDIESQISALETELSNLEKNYSQLESNLERAKSNLSQGKVTARQTYDESMLTYKNAQTVYNIAVESVGDSLDDAQEALEEAQEQWKEFKNTIGEGTITAEYSGTLTALSCEKGDTLSSGTELATYTDADAVTLTVSVSQEDISKAEVGDTVEIVFTAYEDKTYEGTVTEISTSANSSSTVSYDVTITVDGDIEGLYAGMTGSVIFITKKVENVIYVSNKAITTDGAKSYVKRKVGDTTETVEVETGFSDGTSVEITSGLEAGDVVLIESQVKSE